eukprot:gene6500-3139_t
MALQITNAKGMGVRPAPVKRSGVKVFASASGRTDPKQRIVITGMGVASVFGNDHDVFYSKLCDGVSGVKTIDRFDISEYPTKFAAQITDFSADGLIDAKSLRRYDDCLRYTMVAGRKALIEAGLDKEKNPEGHAALDLTRVGVLIGTGMGGLTVFQDGINNMLQKGDKKISPFFIPYAITNMGGVETETETCASFGFMGPNSSISSACATANYALVVGFMGPNYSISTACATANYAFVSAANHIRQGDCDVVVVGGSEAPIMPVGLGGFVACRALSTRNDEPEAASRCVSGAEQVEGTSERQVDRSGQVEGAGGRSMGGGREGEGSKRLCCMQGVVYKEQPETASRPWDSNRDGFVMGEGAGVMVFETLEHAQKRGATIIAEYLGGAMTCDAHHMTDPRKDGLGVSSCINLCLKDSKVDRGRVNYINAHATSTLVGDIAEVNAIKKVFTDVKGMKMNATKSMIGHCLGAAGGLEGVAVVKAITTGWLHPTLNQGTLIDEVGDIDTVPNVKQQFKVDVGISNSFGFGGHNSVVAFAPFKE